MTAKAKATFETLKWKCLVCGDASPRRFQRDMESSRGWLSDPGTQFPVDVVLAFPKPVNIWKVTLEFGSKKQAKKVEVRLGAPKKVPSIEDANANADDDEDESEEPTYADAKEAKYEKRQTVAFAKQHSLESDSSNEKTIFVDVVVQFAWLVIHEPFEGTEVNLKRITFHGYTNIYPSAAELAARKKTQEKLEKEANAAAVGGGSMRAPGTAEGDRRSSKSSQSTRRPASRASVGIGTEDYREHAMQYSSDGDGLKTGEEGTVASDPLTSVRAIKRVLTEKMSRARREDREVEATTCKRGIERLSEYEERIQELKTKMSQALEAEDHDYAERYRLAAIDCRDTVFRVIHLDLLLDSEELRSLGMQSKWSD